MIPGSICYFFFLQADVILNLDILGCLYCIHILELAYLFSGSIFWLFGILLTQEINLCWELFSVQHFKCVTKMSSLLTWFHIKKLFPLWNSLFFIVFFFSCMEFVDRFGVNLLIRFWSIYSLFLALLLLLFEYILWLVFHPRVRLFYYNYYFLNASVWIFSIDLKIILSTNLSLLCVQLNLFVECLISALKLTILHYPFDSF